MCDKEGEYHYWKHRIFYFAGGGQQGISYSLCLYNLTSEDSEAAYLINTMTGEKKFFSRMRINFFLTGKNYIANDTKWEIQ